MIGNIVKTEKFSNWIIEIPSEISEKEGYTKGSKIILNFQDGKIQAEIIPPTSQEIKNEVSRIVGKYGKAFEELKRLGD